MSLRCEQLSKTFRTRNGEVAALEDVSFSAKEHEFICIVGPSGCGKSTLLRLITGLLEPDSGVVQFNSGGNVNNVRCSLVFQEHGLFPWMTVLDNVGFGLEMQGVSKNERREKAYTFIDQFGLGNFAHHYPHELSVGMQQRVGIARAFLSNPQMLLMDEPFGSLDAQTKLVLREELLRIWKNHQSLVLYVTHDIEEAILLGDRILVMTGRPGKILADIPIPFSRPREHIANLPEMAEIEKKIWNMLEAEVRKSLGLSQNVRAPL